MTTETHFRIVRGPDRCGFENLPCLLARAWPDGSFELLNPAWDALGYSAAELSGRSFCELVALDPEPACAAAESLLREAGAVAFGLRCKDGRAIEHHWSREFDAATGSMFIVGDELSAPNPARQA